jgi:preprotein translocase subunit SecE
VSGFIREMVRTGVYKRSQGRICRQVTFAVIAIVVALGLFRLSQVLIDYGQSIQYGVSALLLLVGLWCTFRLVNVPAFADFLIAVEAEMNKVSWPTRQELFRGSAVVLITMGFLAAMLFFFDAFWKILFTYMGLSG